MAHFPIHPTVMCNEINGNEIRCRLFEIATLVFGFDLGEYLRQENKELFGILINNVERRCVPLFGACPANLIDEANRQYLDCKAGYRVNGCARHRRLDPNADLFLVSASLILEPRSTIDALMIHELCHLVVESEFVCQGMLQAAPEVDPLVNAVHRPFDQVEGIFSIHSVEFCRLLVAASAKSVEVNIGFLNQEDAIAQAVQFETARFGMPWFDAEGRLVRT